MPTKITQHNTGTAGTAPSINIARRDATGSTAVVAFTVSTCNGRSFVHAYLIQIISPPVNFPQSSSQASLPFDAPNLKMFVQASAFRFASCRSPLGAWSGRVCHRRSCRRPGGRIWCGAWVTQDGVSVARMGIVRANAVGHGGLCMDGVGYVDSGRWRRSDGTGSDFARMLHLRVFG
jgi:hypothetical protein